MRGEVSIGCGTATTDWRGLTMATGETGAVGEMNCGEIKPVAVYIWAERAVYGRERADEGGGGKGCEP